MGQSLYAERHKEASFNRSAYLWGQVMQDKVACRIWFLTEVSYIIIKVAFLFQLFAHV